ncbi:hypothetical protein [Lentzea tibetensis]|uniref:hypothetical protein n=1 Tax=Lentzea tibetensis TaxID=2591470 RepID=UPI001C993325|nr:hypothetical protein [Lentzea tibetensis]
MPETIRGEDIGGSTVSGPARTSYRRLDRLGDPARCRHQSGTTSLRPTWRQLLTAQAKSIIAADFFHIDTALGKRLYALAFLEHGTRRLHITSVTTHPTRDWTVQQARNLAADLALRMESPRFLLRDRDGKYGETFDTVVEAEDLRMIKSAPQAPRRVCSAACARRVSSIR